MATATEQKRRVLFADDDPFFRELGEQILEEAGFDVLTAADGRQALAHLSEATVDLAILDVDMPVCSGMEALTEIRANSLTQSLPVLVITGDDDSDAIRKAFDAGASSFMAKPFEWSLLIHHIGFLLKAARQDAALRDAIRGAEMLQASQEEMVKALANEARAPLKSAMNFIKLMKLETHGPLGTDFYRTCVSEIDEAMDQINQVQMRLLHGIDPKSITEDLEEQEFGLEDYLIDIVAWFRDEANARNINTDTTQDLAADLAVVYDRVLFVHALKSMLGYVVEMSRRHTLIECRFELAPNGDLEVTAHNALDRLNATPRRRRTDEWQLTESERAPLSYGLQRARTIAQAHGGDIEIAPPEDPTRRVKFIIPAARLSSSSGSTTEQPKEPPLFRSKSETELFQSSRKRSLDADAI